jgi:hypothetical protein
MFEKIEPFLTFLVYEELDRKSADIQSKIDELEELNQSFRERDRTKDDAIAQLSDQHDCKKSNEDKMVTDWVLKP